MFTSNDIINLPIEVSCLIKPFHTPSDANYAAQFDPSHDEDFYRRFFTGDSDSVGAYIEQMSGGAVRFSGKGPIVAPSIYTVPRFNPDKTPRSAEQIRTDVIAAAAATDVDFSVYLPPLDSQLDNGEVVVFLVGAGWGDAAIVRDTAPKILELPSEPRLKLRVGSMPEWLGSQSTANDGESLVALATHEVLHIIAYLKDLYGPWKNGSWNTPASLAGKISGYTQLDPVQKMMAGWLTPRIHDLALSPHICETLAAPGSLPSTATVPQPALLFDSRRGTNEFFMLEYRTPTGAGTATNYDSAVREQGLAVWHVTTTGNGLLERDAYIEGGKRTDSTGQTQLLPFQTPAPQGDDQWGFDRTIINWGNDGVLDTAAVGTDVVKKGPAINLFAPPDGVIGLRHGFWRAEHGAFALRWIDQTDVGIRVQVADAAVEAQQIDVFISRTSLPYSRTNDLTIRDCYARVTGNSIDASIGDDDGILYPVHSDGTLGWYRHLDRLNGSAEFANNGNEKVLSQGESRGDGWSAFKTVVAGGNGVLYAIKQDGTLAWYRHLGWEDGSAEFANNGNEKVLIQGESRGDSWSAFKTVVAGGNGVLYAIKQDGTLAWYRHLGWEDGSAEFANNGNEKVLSQGESRGDGWSAFKTVAVNTAIA